MWRLVGNITHSPGPNYGILIVLSVVSAADGGSSTAYCRQIFLPEGENNIYTRRLYNGTWQKWGKITATDVS